MKKQRPVNLNLLTIKFPMPAVISILHRISGVFLFFFIPILLCVLQCSLASSADFNYLHSWFEKFWMKLFIWIFLVAFGYHFIAGIRHLIMDLGIGESLDVGRKSAFFILFLTVFWAIIAGIWLW